MANMTYDIDKSTLWIASGFIVALVIHILQQNIPHSIDLWPARPSGRGQDTMYAIQYSSNRSSSNSLTFVSKYPRPILRPNQVLVKVKYSALNPCDFKFRRNTWIPNFLVPDSKIPGEDLSGILVELGSEVQSQNSWKIGDHVAAMMPLLGSRWGSLAEYAAVDVSFLARVGLNTTLLQAASMPLVGLTVVQAMNLWKRRKQHNSILIHAGAGGVGTFAIQYAKNVLHFDWIATTASSDKRDLLIGLGADQVIDYHTTKFEDVISNYDVVLDTMSWAYESRTWNNGVLNGRGHYFNILSSDWIFHNGRERTNGIWSALRLIYSKIRNIILPGHVPQYDMIAVTPNGTQLQSILDLVNVGLIRPVVDRVFTLKEAEKGLIYLEGGHASGKVMIHHEISP
jgi:alcohol dehydrogenase